MNDQVRLYGKQNKFGNFVVVVQLMLALVGFLISCTTTIDLSNLFDLPDLVCYRPRRCSVPTFFSRQSERIPGEIEMDTRHTNLPE